MDSAGCRLMPTNKQRNLRQEKADRLARGEPFVVSPKEVAKVTGAYQADPEILLGRMSVGGARDTGEIVKTKILLSNGMQVSDAAREAYLAFKRVWSSPRPEEVIEVERWATRIRDATSKGDGPFRWSRPV
jgi:hypothetical protein